MNFIDGLLIGILVTIIVAKTIFDRNIKRAEKAIADDFDSFMEFVTEQAIKTGNLSKIEVCDSEHNVLKTFDPDKMDKFSMDEVREVIKESEENK